eukprot:3936320-Rhodomonas_salina.3
MGRDPRIHHDGHRRAARTAVMHRKLEAVTNTIRALTEYLGVRRALAQHSFPLDHTSTSDPSASAGSSESESTLLCPIRSCLRCSSGVPRAVSRWSALPL